MKKSLILLTVAVISALGVGGVVRNVYASQNQHPATPSEQALAQANLSDGEQPDAQEEQQEDAHLQALARITPQQAVAIARTVASGPVSQTSLDNEDGSVVYKLIIGSKEVMVDAGNGQVLETETAGQESSQDAAPQGSIQVP